MPLKNPHLLRDLHCFTHFGCIPLITDQWRQFLLRIQKIIEIEMIQKGIIPQESKQKINEYLRRHDSNLGHVTLFMMTLKRQQIKNKLLNVLQNIQPIIIDCLQTLLVKPLKIQYFTRYNKNSKQNELTVIYLSIDQQSQQKLFQLADKLLRLLLEQQIIMNEQLKQMRVKYNHKSNKFQVQTFHISLFRCQQMFQTKDMEQAFINVNDLMLKQTETKLKFLNDKGGYCQLFDIATMKQHCEKDKFYKAFHRSYTKGKKIGEQKQE